MGEAVVTLNGSSGTVAWVHAVPGQADMYNLTIANDHTYALGGPALANNILIVRYLASFAIGFAPLGIGDAYFMASAWFGQDLFTGTALSQHDRQLYAGMAAFSLLTTVVGTGLFTQEALAAEHTVTELGALERLGTQAAHGAEDEARLGEAVAQEGLAAEQVASEAGAVGGAERYFVHGTTTAEWNDAQRIIGERGGGEFGQGFYTFEDTRWGRNSAWKWAVKKTNAGGDPILVRVKIPEDVFQALDKQHVTEEELGTAYERLHDYGVSGGELVWGPVSKRGANVARERDYTLPEQFKFEGTGVDKLQIDSILNELSW